MTKTSVDVYMLFTCFVNFNNDYEGLFKICNTDTYLYCFYIKKENIFLSKLYILLSFINKHIFFLWISHWIFAVSLTWMNKRTWKQHGINLKLPNYRSQNCESEKCQNVSYSIFLYFHILLSSASICLLSRPKKTPQEISLYTYSWFNTRRLSRAAIQRN